MATDYLSLRGITKTYAGHAVVSDVSLAIHKGEILTILGPSGCGKTTTLKIIAGFVEPDAGSVLVEDRAVDHLSSHERGAAMVFQNYALFPHLTVTQNIAFGLRMRRLAEGRDRRGRSTTCWRACGLRRSATAIRRSCRAASSSASRWRAR